MPAAPAGVEHPWGTMPLTPGERLRRLLRLQVHYAFFATLHWTLGYFFLVEERGLPIPTVLLIAGLLYGSGAVVLLALPAFEARWTLRLGFLCRILAIVPYWLFPSLPGLLVASAFFGAALALFWLPYNLIFFEHRARTTNAGASALYASVQPAIDVVAALLAGWIVIQWGFPALFAAAILMGLIGWPATFRLRPRAPLRLALRERLARIRGLRALILMDGVSQGVVWTAVPLVTLVFIQDAFEFAAFFALLAIAGAIGALIMGRLSDRRAKRFAFIWPVAAAFALANLLSVFAVVSVVFWGVLRGVATLTGVLFDPFRTAVLLDTAPTVEDLFIAREFLVSCGRAGGVVAVFLVHLAGPLQFVFLLPAALAVAVPLVIVARNLYPEERTVFRPFRGIFRQ